MGRNRKHYSESFKNKVIVELLKSGRRQEEVATEYGISQSTLSEWKTDFLSGRNQKELKEANKRIEELEEQNKALIEALGSSQLEVELLKKKDITKTEDEIMNLVDTDLKLSISKQCELLGIARSSYYNWLKSKDQKKDSSEDSRLDIVLSKWAEYNSPGYRKLSRSMLEDRLQWATERVVRRLYKRLCIHGISPVFKTTRPLKGRKSKHGYLLRGKKIMYVNQVWSTDITYIKIGDRMMYFTAVIDLFSRKILSWRLMNSMETRYCIEVVEEAITEYGIPAIFNSDCGSQYTSESFEQMLEGYGILVSHDGIGRCLDNIYVERTWRTLKYEWIFLKDYRDEDSLRKGLDYFVGFYNTKRLYQSLEYMTPNKVYYSGCFPKGNINNVA